MLPLGNLAADRSGPTRGSQALGRSLSVRRLTPRVPPMLDHSTLMGHRSVQAATLDL
jgi:hypothetical protein